MRQLTAGILYIVATPIGNMADLSPRAQEILNTVELILAEDTRHSKPMLLALGIHTRLRACHEHNEQRISPALIDEMQAGLQVALIADAGTPLINDPGYRLVCLAHEHNIPVCPVPGPSALIAALSAAGLPTNRFVFEGYLPAQAHARQQRLHALANEQRTLICYEVPHRILATVTDMMHIFGDTHLACIAKELSKVHEHIQRAPLVQIRDWLYADPKHLKGEFVLIVDKHSAPASNDYTELLQILLESMSIKAAVNVIVRLGYGKRNAVYQQALEINRTRQK